jgi:DHA1 family bicyclomycin/chloramphenicol resistance-like MFS transporter
MTDASPAATATAGRPAVSVLLAATALALLLGLQPATTDIYLPALPLLTRELGAPMSAVQLTMSALILAFGIAQLVWGPVADRIGRRPVLLIGLALYTAASVGAMLAADIGLLIVWRALQGACLAAAVVCARAMVRDLYEPQQGAQVMAWGLSGLGLIAIGGPALGGLAAWIWGWRSALAMVAGFGALTLAFVALCLPETLARKNPRATEIGPLVRSWSRIARHPAFVAWTLLISCTYGGLFTLLAGSAFIYIDVLGLSPGHYGLAMASGSASYLLGTFVCRRWIVRHGLAGAVRRGAGFTLVGGLAMLALALAGVHAVWAVLLPQWLFAFGHGIHQPCGQTGAVGAFPQAAGAASALSGFVLAATAFFVSRWLGGALDGTVLPLAQGVAFWSVLTAATAWTLVQRLSKTAQQRPAG